MAKPPVDTYDKMIKFLQSQLHTKRFLANYQPVMIKLLLEKGNQTKQQIAEELWKQNNSERETSFYLSVPVYRVLVDNGVVTKNGNIFFDLQIVYAVSIAKAFIESGMKKNVLIVGAEKYTSILNYEDRGTCFIFGDGAGAAIISATDNKDEAIVDVNCSSDGNYDDLIKTPGGGSKHPCSQEVLDQKLACIQMKGNETFKLAVKTLTSDVKVMLEKHNLTNADIKHFIPHQANMRIIKAVGTALGLSEEQTVVTVDKYGNTSAASIPMAMNYAYEQGRIKAGDTVLFDAFGAGLTWGSALFPFSPKK